MSLGNLFNKAKENLLGIWGKAIGSSLLLSIIYIALFIVWVLFASLITSLMLSSLDGNNAGIWFGLLIIILAAIALALIGQLLYVGYQFAVLDKLDKGEYRVTSFFDILNVKPLKMLGLIAMTALLVFLWSLLLVVPGIIKAISYSQSFYILKENPEKSIMDCISESRKVMKGNKGLYFGILVIFALFNLIPIILFGSPEYKLQINGGQIFSDFNSGYWITSTIISVFVTVFASSVYANFYRTLVPLDSNEESAINGEFDLFNNENANSNNFDINNESISDNNIWSNEE
ncbi:MAG: DUF975 family protein [Erysipelotrichales bacterium]